ncbi:MAG: DUF1786 domain-containing protein [Anaerolineae bacterium]|nr:DUF1786 domain-containing protein [Anaerolineae bacterium]MCB0245156.1 DUF1786 domain-containing protein [Anaerolineae bacterium]MCO5246043.1 DUF1786 domain-containing protein [Anaerolineae bacterium]HRX01546.1 DUF1786 family protein [Anaerolineae bacterium]
MQILAVDVGTGTQDILLFDSTRTPENCLKLVMPSPTMLVASAIRRATGAGNSLLLTGVTMGGGPSSWATEDHHRAGLPIYATADAARSFNDDLDAVRRDLGIEIISDDEAARLASQADITTVELRDFSFAAISQAFHAFGLDLRPDAVMVAVFDHGNAPPDVSDRQFRLDYLADRLRSETRLSTFAFPAHQTPTIMTRLQAVVDSASDVTAPLLVMDTAPAAVLGALCDPAVAAQPDAMIVNVGNFHCLAFQYRHGQFMRLFEHHTGLLTAAELEIWLRQLASGEITHQEVFAEHGHGALVLDRTPVLPQFVAVTGPRRAMLAASTLPTYFAVPYGDQMLAGCWGMIRAAADHLPDQRDEILAALAGDEAKPLW